MDSSYNAAMRNPLLQVANSYHNSPDTTRLTLEQEYNRNKVSQPQQNQSNPYSDYVNVFNSLSDVAKEKILADERFSSVYAQCEACLKEYIYAQALPYVLETQGGRISFEQLYSITKTLKDEMTQRDLKKEKQLELLMQDEVVLKRLQELQAAQTLEGNSKPTSKKTKPALQPQPQSEVDN